MPSVKPTIWISAHNPKIQDTIHNGATSTMGPQARLLNPTTPVDKNRFPFVSNYL